MPRYIDAEVLKSRLEVFSRWCKDGRKKGVDFVLDCPLPDTPTADVQEVRHGKWIVNDLTPYCSVCYRPSEYECDGVHSKPLFCSHCGAKMNGGID